MSGGTVAEQQFDVEADGLRGVGDGSRARAAMRPAQQVGRDILTALEAMRPSWTTGPGRRGTPLT